MTGYGQATIDTTTSNQTTLTVKGIKEDDGKIAADSTQDVNIVMDGTYNASYNKVATQTTVSNAIVALDGIPTTVDITSSTDVITTVSETNGVVSSTKKTIVEGNKIDINVPTTGTSTGDIIISHEDIDTTATDVASTITTDSSSTVDEKELNIITGLKVDAQGHITHIDKDKSTNLVAADIKGSVSVTDDSAWIYRPTGGTISIGEDIAKVNGLEGNSCVWNQLQIKPTSLDSFYRNQVTGASFTDGIITFTVTAKNGNVNLYPLPVSLVTGHKLFVSAKIRTATPTTLVTLGFDSLSKKTTESLEWQVVSFIKTAQSSRGFLSVTDARNSGFDGIMATDFMVIDLTLLGIDNLTTVEEVEAWLAQHVGLKSYYAYNAGEILSAKTLGFNTYGQNLLNPTTKQARLVTYTDATNSNKYTIKNIPDETTVTYTPDNTGTSVDITSLIENDTFDITSYGDGILELSAVADDTYVCIKWDGSKDDDIVPYKEHNYNFDVAKVYGRVSGAGDYVQCFPNGMQRVNAIHDRLSANEAVASIGKRAYQSGDESDTTVLTDKTNTLYILATPITYTNLIYSEDGGQTGTPLKKVLLTMNVNDFGTEEQILPDYVDDNPTSVPANVVIEYKSNFKEAVLETIDKVNSYKNPVRGANDTPQTTDKLAVYDSDSTVKSSTYEISNSTIDPEGTSNNTIVPTVNAVVDYVENVIDTEVTVKDITTTDDDTSGNGGIRVTNSGTTYDVHHANITQTDTTKQSTGEVVANVVTNVTVDSFGHVKGKEVISSDKLIAADIKAPVKQTDNNTWNHRITGGDISIGEDTAKISVLKGNTIVWNQLVDSSATSITLVSNNKYLTIIGGTKSIQTGAGTAITVTGGTDIVINLTKMFGSGNEPSTVEEFEKLFPNSYYEYNEGELVSLDVEGVKSIGFNQWDEEWEHGFINTNTGQNEDSSTNACRSINYIKVSPSASYYFKMPANSLNARIFFYDSNESFISFLYKSASGIFTIPSNCCYMRFYFWSSITTYYNYDICINISDPAKNGTYEPYKQDTLDLSWIKDIKDTNDNQLFPYGLLSAGSVYDEVTETMAVKRMGVVDLGSLTSWQRVLLEGVYVFRHPFTESKATASGHTPIVCNQYNYTLANTAILNNDKSIGIQKNYYWTTEYIFFRDDSHSAEPTSQDNWLDGVILYYELATPIEVDIVPAKNMSYLVNDLGTETQLPVNSPTTTPITAPFVGTFEYKSNFKDTVIDLINKVNNAANPVKGINNTDQTVGKIAVYDSKGTTASSDYSASNATIVEGATGNDIILPAVETVVNYVNSKLSSALTYKGTVAQWSDLPTSGQNTGDMYIVSTTFTEQGVTYNAGDFFIWNGSSWDIVSGTTSVDDKDISLTMNGTRVTVATVDGNDIHITPPNLNVSSPSSSSGTGVDFVDTISQTNGLISYTKKRVRSASTSQDGIVTLSSGIESTSSEDSKVPTAYDTLTNLNNRDVDSGTITNDIATLSKRMLDEDSTSPTYESWINKTFYPETKYNAITDFPTAFGTNYPDLNTIESLSTTGFLKRTGSNTWELTDDTGKMKWLDEVTNTYTYSAASTNLEELGSYIHNYYGITSIEKAVLDNNNYGFRIDVPILSSSTATLGTVLKGTKTTGVTTLPIWGQLGIEELDELDNLGSNTGYLKRKAGATAGTYEWELSTPASTTVATTKNDGTETTPSSTMEPALKITTNGTTTYHKVPFSAISNDDSTGANAVTIILNGNFN